MPVIINGNLSGVNSLWVGPQGYQGSSGGGTGSGSQGNQGWQGSIGLQGPSGGGTGSGSQGNQGFQGLIGVTGNQGNQGRQGWQGYQGWQGLIGIQGNQGLIGVTGSQGNIGSQGWQGLQGPSGGGTGSGSQGNQGFQGLIGVTGNQGNIGSQGNQGFQGLIGVTGNQGNIGSQGNQGFQGLIGVTGSQGTQGNQGWQGNQGFQGNQGWQGNQGNIGVGTQGNQGWQGNQGNQGNQGPAPTGQIILTAAGGWPSITSGASLPSQIESTTNDVNYYSVSFADGSTTRLEWSIAMPSDYDGGTITAVFYWLADTSSTNSVVWGLSGRSFGDNEAIDQAFGTVQTVTDANNGTNTVNISSTTSAITLAGTPAAGEYVQLRAERQGAAGGDTLAAAALLLQVRVTYTRV
jgi:hypothetical protein